MSLNKEWGARVEAWISELRCHFYAPLGTLELEGFTTFDRLSAAEAAARSFRPFPAGCAWGAKWEYGWFRASLSLPTETAGRRVVLRLKPAQEGLVFLDGRAAGAVDREHPDITLARPAKGGERFEILAEFYAGHGPIEENCGPVSPGVVPIPEPGPTQRVVQPSEWGEWDDEAFALWLDAETLFQTRNTLPETSLRVSEIDAGLREFATIVDFELPSEAMRATFGIARERLKSLLACRNGPTAPVMHAFGNSHLDLAWQWPWEETVRKSARTMSTQLALLDEYPEFPFLLCQVPLMEALRDEYPELWGRVKAKIAEGSVIVDGGMWLEPDTNLPWGEALIRQVSLAKRFFREELGKDTRVLWLPDSFGFSAALPQIMKGTGLDYFATKKIVDNYGDGDPFPHVVFSWSGLDGSAVLAHIYRKADSPITPKMLAKRWNFDRRQLDGLSSYLYPFGYGDGGGGPTREMLEFACRLRDLEGLPRVESSSPLRFFEDLESKGPPERAYSGEIYFQEHRGTYTTQARTKRANRSAEIALRDAELWRAFARRSVDLAPAQEDLSAAWRRLLFNHFHDILPGTSIARVHAEAVSELEGVRAKAEELRASALEALRGASVPGYTFFNSLSWERTAQVLLPGYVGGALVCPRGDALETQACADGTYVELRLPPCGWTSARQAAPAAAPSSSPAVSRGGVYLRREAGCYVLENEKLRATVDSLGRLPSVIDKSSGLELAAGPCNELRLFKDVNSNYDAWDIESLYAQSRIDLGEGGATVEVLAEGPLFASLLVRRAIASSSLEQEIRLERDSRTIEFRTKVDWREDHKLLKAAFPTNLRADDALYEIQFGHVRRPTHRNRRYDADRFECCQHRWIAIAESSRGVAILNDCKYGSDALGGTIGLTLLKAPFVPDMGADRGVHEFVYALYVWSGPFATEGPIRAGYCLNVPPAAAPGSATGDAEGSLLSIDSPAIVLEAAKLADDGSGDLVLRLYESTGGAARTTVRLDPSLRAESLRETDMLESSAKAGGNRVELQDGAVELEFRAFEIKTLRVSGQSGGRAAKGS